MKAYEMMKKQRNGSPVNPRLGQLWNEPYTQTLRVWDGKKWRETGAKEMAAMIKKHGSLAKWLEAESKEGKLL